MFRGVQAIMLALIFGFAADHAHAQDIGIESNHSNSDTFRRCHDAGVKGMSCIPGGAFIRGSEAPRTCGQGEVRRFKTMKPNHRPVQTIVLSTFYMDQTEVTFSAYQACVKSGRCRPSRPAYNDYDAPEQPMVGLRWYDAHQYCKAQGKRLPTEAEWEKAARGPDGQLFPWGAEPADCERAVIKDAQLGRSCGIKKKGSKGWKGKTLPVKSRPAGRYGLFDRIGTAVEWTSDWHSRDWETYGEACSTRDPKGPCEIKRSMQHVKDTGVRLSAVDHGTGPASARPAGRVDRIFPRTNPTITLGSVARRIGKGPKHCFRHQRPELYDPYQSHDSRSS